MSETVAAFLRDIEKDSTTFIVSPERSVLVLEDMEQRIAWFRKRILQATFCVTAAQAIHALQSKHFDIVFLDHDLGFMDAADHTRSNGNGKEVARYLAAKKFPGIIVIHSLNEKARAIMKRILPYAHIAPFGSFEISPKLPGESEWVEELLSRQPDNSISHINDYVRKIQNSE